MRIDLLGISISEQRAYYYYTAHQISITNYCTSNFLAAQRFHILSRGEQAHLLHLPLMNQNCLITFNKQNEMDTVKNKLTCLYDKGCNKINVI
jgi:hypothetical protein